MNVPLDAKYEIDYLLYALSDGDPSKRDVIGNSFSYPDAVKWNALGLYRSKLMDEDMKSGK